MNILYKDYFGNPRSKRIITQEMEIELRQKSK